MSIMIFKLTVNYFIEQYYIITTEHRTICIVFHDVEKHWKKLFGPPKTINFIMALCDRKCFQYMRESPPPTPRYRLQNRLFVRKVHDLAEVGPLQDRQHLCELWKSTGLLQFPQSVYQIFHLWQPVKFTIYCNYIQLCTNICKSTHSILQLLVNIYSRFTNCHKN